MMEQEGDLAILRSVLAEAEGALALACSGCPAVSGDMKGKPLWCQRCATYKALARIRSLGTYADPRAFTRDTVAALNKAAERIVELERENAGLRKALAEVQAGKMA